MGSSSKSIYQWLLCSLLFIHINGSPSHIMKSIIVHSPESHNNILGSEARTQQGTCGNTNSYEDTGECDPEEKTENCTYECRLLHEPPRGYTDLCEFVEENCGDEYELLNYLQFMNCHLGTNLRVHSGF